MSIIIIVNLYYGLGSPEATYPNKVPPYSEHIGYKINIPRIEVNKNDGK